MENVTIWDEPPSSSGVQHVAIPLEPDDSALDLVEEGVEEADRELRLEANAEEEDVTVEP